MEVMGLMLGEFVDDYTVRVIDVFAMPQSGTVRLEEDLDCLRLCCNIYLRKVSYSCNPVQKVKGSILKSGKMKLEYIL